MKVKQISIFLENEAGRLLELTETLSRTGINIRALSLAETADYGILRLIVDQPDKALGELKDQGFSVAETEVIVVEVPDCPGGLAEVLRPLSREGINVEYMYAFVEKKEGNAVVVFRVDDPEETIAALAQDGINVLPAAEVYGM